ncbi:MAG: CDP-alcohol phosphatidyltransferase family protein [Paludibacteraceae bacterium]|nr:CDP-alcohol phosphatidyltransferase family protein [Paludibacteraceae bacterium]
MSIVKHIPNTITCLNLISGAIACVLAFNHLYFYASLAIYCASIFDFFDGMAARLLHVSSPIGKELDSLADDISFGLAPGMILCVWLKEVTNADLCDPLPYLCFILSAFAAIRLAKFNLDERQTSSFIGLPTPPVSMLTASLIALFDTEHIWGTYNVEWLRGIASNPYVILAYVAIFSYLMICELPMFSLKVKHLHWKGNEPKYILIGSSILLLIGLQMAAIPAIILLFITMSVIIYLFGSKKKEA